MSKSSKYLIIVLFSALLVENSTFQQENTRKRAPKAIDLFDTHSTNEEVPKSCYEATREERTSGVYEIVLPNISPLPINVYCSEDYFGGWTLVLRNAKLNILFNRTWEEYKIGFGHIRGDFFIGLENLHELTTSVPQELLIKFRYYLGDDDYAYGFYPDFVIGSESELYKIKSLGEATYNYYKFRDSFRSHLGHNFSTFDRDNDNYWGNCAQYHLGGWWFHNCRDAMFTSSSITWSGYTSTIYEVEMMIRPNVGQRHQDNLSN